MGQERQEDEARTKDISVPPHANTARPQPNGWSVTNWLTLAGIIGAVLIAGAGAFAWMYSAGQDRGHNDQQVAALQREIDELKAEKKKSATRAAPADTSATPNVEPQQEPETARAEIATPPANTTVTPVIHVSGRVADAPKGRHLWLVTRREQGGDFWPKARVAPDADGSFGKKIWDHGADGPLWICVLAVDPSETRRFEEWQREGDRVRDWPSLQLRPEVSAVIGCSEYVLDNPKYP